MITLLFLTSILSFGCYHDLMPWPKAQAVAQWCQAQTPESIGMFIPQNNVGNFPSGDDLLPELGLIKQAQAVLASSLVVRKGLIRQDWIPSPIFSRLSR